MQIENKELKSIRVIVVIVVISSCREILFGVPQA